VSPNDPNSELPEARPDAVDEAAQSAEQQAAKPKTAVTQVRVAREFDGQRLDRWFKQQRPGLSFGRLSKLLRTGQIRVDSKRAKPDTRLSAGQMIRIPPLELDTLASPSVISAASGRSGLSEAGRALLEQALVYEDDDMVALNKPPGLAVQGGSGTARHLDGMVAGWRKGGRLRLVHRLDKDTSGLILLAKSVGAASRLTQAFKTGGIEKTYWAVVVGRPPFGSGEIKAPIAKMAGTNRAGGAGSGAERMVVSDQGQFALTHYQVLDRAGHRAAWLALSPRTGRTHQLRVHCEHMGTPILGDGKYGGQAAFLDGLDLSRKLHLHARQLLVPHPELGTLRLTADLPSHMVATFDTLGFSLSQARDLDEDAPWR
jgi:23S rRNA pseudouridine955/2504/2580 synthase